MRSRCVLACLTATLTFIVPLAVLSSFSKWCALRQSDLTLMCDMLGAVATQLDAANVTCSPSKPARLSTPGSAGSTAHTALH